MVELVVFFYVLLCDTHVEWHTLNASRSHALSNLARGKELTQFYNIRATQSISHLKWAPLWPVPIIRGLITLLKWHFSK